MGKWTPNYTDDVLNIKISALVTGAINRAAVEKEPTITFEDFVKELDTGDAFTTSLIDILVKELAERHTRPNQNGERRLIAPRTAEQLNSLVHARPVYRGDRPRGRNHFGRRALNLSEFMNYPANDMDTGEDEDDFGSLLDGTVGAAEGARFNNDLFEAYGSHPWSPFARRSGNSPSPPLEDEPPTWRVQSTDRASAWTAPPPSSNANAPATSLTRHPSIRRPTRSRFLDFNDWTTRRRSTIRDAIGNQNAATDGPSSLSLGNDGESGPTVRRFFGTRRLARRPNTSEDRDWGEEERSYPLDISLDHQWPSSLGPLAGTFTTDPPPNSVESEDRPALRRGGVHPPEVLIISAPEALLTQRHSGPTAWPSSRTSDPAARGTSIVVLPSPTPVDSIHPMSPGREDVVLASADPVGYPTPSSIDTEPSST